MHFLLGKGKETVFFSGPLFAFEENSPISAIRVAKTDGGLYEGALTSY
jgi:hypothetical protein